jgi:hypothetical protein
MDEAKVVGFLYEPSEETAQLGGQRLDPVGEAKSLISVVRLGWAQVLPADVIVALERAVELLDGLERKEVTAHD